MLWFTIFEVTSVSQGFAYNPPPLISIPLQILIVLFISKLLPLVVSGPLQVLQTFTAVFLTIPTVVLAFTNALNIEFRFRFLGLIYVLLNQVLVSFFHGEREWLFAKNRKLRMSLPNIGWLLSCLVVALFAFSLTSGVLDLNFVTFNEIYGKRSDLKVMLGDSDMWFLAYSLGWLGGICVPIVFYIGIKSRNWLMIILSLFFFLGSYLLTAQKWIIASCALILFLHLISLFAKENLVPTSNVFVGFNWLILILIFLQSFFSRIPLVDLGIRRALLDPSIMLQYYVKFAGNYPPQWWSDSNLVRSVFNTDPMPVSQIIGERYFEIPTSFIFPKGESPNATGGAIADSIAQGGIIGLLIISLTLICVFYGLHFLSIGRDRSIVFVMSALFVEMLVEGTFHTLLLSRGLILIFVVFLLLPKQKILA